MVQQNNSPGHPDWVQGLIRQAPISRALILFSNIQDAFYDPQQRQYVTLPELLTRIFTREQTLGYSMTGIWDQVDGLRFANQQMLSRFRKVLAGQPAQKENSTSEQAYDLGAQTNTQAATPGNALYPDLTELMAAIRPVMDSPQEQPVFIIDYSQLLITQPDHPDPNERGWMMQMTKSINGPNVIAMNSDTLKRSGGLLVLLTTTLGKIPPLLYQNDPRVKVISVPTPTRPERLDFFMRHMDDLRCQRPKDNGAATTQASGRGQLELANTLADLTDQLKVNDLKQILSMSLITEMPLPPEKLLNLYRFGDQRSPWEELSEEKLKHVDEILKKRVVGQDDAVDHVGTIIIRAFMGLAGLQHSGKRSKPKGTIIFVGPTGVGKTELAKAIAELLFGDEASCLRYDMSEYNHEHSDQRLVGAPPGYVGFEEGGQLTNAARDKPFSVFLFDEIEKANGKILDKFLQVLEDGRLTDGRGETAHFSESVIIFTSNIGASDMPKTDDPEEIKEHFLKAVESHFVHELKRPELLNRLGNNVVVFNKISDTSFRRTILDKKLAPLKSYLMERFGVNFLLCEEAAKGLLNNSKTEHGGRGVLNVVEHELINPLSRFLFDRTHQLRRGRVINVTLVEDKIHFELQEDNTNA